MFGSFIRTALRSLFALGLALSIPAQAHAVDSFVLPDPSDFTLFALGLAGLIIGRHIARKRPRNKQDD